MQSEYLYNIPTNFDLFKLKSHLVNDKKFIFKGFSNL